MISAAILLVLGSGFLHSVWNLYTKQSINKNSFLWLCQLAAVLIFLPWTIQEWDGTHWTNAGLWALLASVILHGLYILLLAAAYSVGDLSQVYPIMRGTSPLLVPLLAVTFLNETLSALGWAGVIGIVVGIAMLSNFTSRRSGSSLKAAYLALAVGVCIAGYIVVDKIALQYVPAVVLNEATSIGNLLALSVAGVSASDLREEFRLNWRNAFIGGLIAPGGYLMFLFALSLAPVAQLAPMREIGTVFGTVMGILILREKQGKRRIIASLLITLGVIALGWA